MALPVVRLFVALAIALALAARGLKKRSLSKSGAAAAFVVGLLSFTASYRFGITLILFYNSSSSLTKVGNAVKAKLEADHKEGGQRGADQVLACSLLATILAVAYMATEGLDDAPVHYAVAPRRSTPVRRGAAARRHGVSVAREVRGAGSVRRGAPAAAAAPVAYLLLLHEAAIVRVVVHGLLVRAAPAL